MVVRGLYLKDFEPIVQPREYLETITDKKFYLVEMIYPLPLLSVDLCDADHLGANVTVVESGEIEIDDVYLDDNEISHMRMIPRDDFFVAWMGKPRARVYYGTKNSRWQLPTMFDDPRTNPAIENLQLNEIFQFEDTAMWITATAYAGVLATARLEFHGYRFLVTEVDKKDLPKGFRPTRIPTQGYPGASK